MYARFLAEFSLFESEVQRAARHIQAHEAFNTICCSRLISFVILAIKARHSSFDSIVRSHTERSGRK